MAPELLTCYELMIRGDLVWEYSARRWQTWLWYLA